MCIQRCERFKYFVFAPDTQLRHRICCFSSHKSHLHYYGGQSTLHRLVYTHLHAYSYRCLIIVKAGLNVYINKWRSLSTTYAFRVEYNFNDDETVPKFNIFINLCESVFGLRCYDKMIEFASEWKWTPDSSYGYF